MISEASTLAEVAFAVCTALHRAGFTVVLTGGSAATYYAPEAYQSTDLDFVVGFHGDDAAAALSTIGYRAVDGRYVHPASPYPIEFPPGPLMIGDELITTWSTVRRGDELLHVLTPTDSCRDRLAAFLHWNDFSALDQALAVAAACVGQIDLAAVRVWCEREGQGPKFDVFERRLFGKSR